MAYTREELFMRRAMELAKLGAGKVSPNPMVGAVLVYEDKIISEGWHENFGGPHAEVNALKKVLDQKILNHSELFVSLEPCSHFGKTPPCADLLIEKNIPKVWISNLDPNPKVSGSGMARLKAHRVNVSLGVLEKEGLELNKRFFSRYVNLRPYIILKWAESKDGFIAGQNYEQVKISNELSQLWNHKMRSQEDAIMVGYNTALYDNPSLTLRHWQGRSPVRITLDKLGRLPKGHHLKDKAPDTYIYKDHKSGNNDSDNYYSLDFDKNLIPQLVQHWNSIPISSVIIEGGTRLLTSFLNENLWDEIHLTVSPKIIGSGIKSPILPFINWQIHQKRGEDDYYFYRSH